jgi:type I restriction enzyme S subunit
VITQKYKAHPRYQSSGEEWLGEVPSTWKVLQLKHLSVVKRGASPRPIDDPKYFSEDGEYAWTRIADVSASETFLIKSTQRLSRLGSSLSVKLQPGELFLSIAGSVGKPCITKIKACIHDGFVYFPELKTPPKFLFYIFAGEQAYKGLGKFGTQLNLNTDTVGSIKVGLPPLPEQIQIARFLDHETGKIDLLIEKQQELIALLKEKRQAVISHAVTKGLSPQAPLKDSGIEWLGQVPEHWEVKPLKHICSLQTGHTPRKSEPRYWVSAECEIPWVSLNDTSTLDADDFISDTTVKITKVGMNNSSAHFIAAGAVVMNRDGARVGLSAIMTRSMCVSQHIVAWECGPTINNHFLLHVLYAMEAEIYRVTWGSTIPTIGFNDIKKMTVAVPPLEEQQRITTEVLKQRKNLSDLTDLAVTKITLLQHTFRT